MTATLHTATTTTRPAAAVTPATAVRAGARTTGIAALVAAVLGAVSTLVLDSSIVEQDVAAAGGGRLVDALNDGVVPLRLSCGLGILAAVALLVVAGGLQRRFEQQGLGDALEVRVLDRALTASAGAMFIGFGARAIMAGSLPDGVDGDFYTTAGREAIYATLNNFPYMAWVGVAIAAGCVALLGVRHRAVTKPVLVVGAVAAVVCAGMTLGLGLPYSSSLVGPVFLVVSGVSLLRTRS